MDFKHLFVYRKLLGDKLTCQYYLLKLAISVTEGTGLELLHDHVQMLTSPSPNTSPFSEFLLPTKSSGRKWRTHCTLCISILVIL